MSQAASLAPTRDRARDRLAAEALPIGVFLVFALLPFLARFAGGGYLLSLGSRVMIFAIAAISLDLLVGYGALISFGHAAFIGLGAYAVGILSIMGSPMHLSPCRRRSPPPRSSRCSPAWFACGPRASTSS